MLPPEPTATPDALFNQSLAKGLQVLCAFQAGHRSLTLGDIAARTGMTKASAQRSVHTLQTLGYIGKHPSTQRFGLLPRVVELGFNYLEAHPLIAAAHSYLAQLARDSGETATVSDYVSQKTMENLETYAAIETRFEELGGQLTAEEEAQADSYASQLMEQYGDTYKANGIGLNTVQRFERILIKSSDLLELVRPAHLKWQPVDLNEVIGHSLQLVSQDASGRDITLQFTAQPSLCRIQADPDRLKQVLLNLYLNAIHAIEHDGVITVAASECGDGRVKISVADSGKGMTAEQLQAIFTPYFTTKAEGTGLGLAIAQEIAQGHGAHLQFAPGALGRGMRVTLMFGE